MAEIAVIGGSGFYTFLEDVDHVTVDTPYGAPSDPVTIGRIAGRSVAFLPRHGRDHRHPPHRIPFRANLWALRSLGVEQIVAPGAVGSLDPTVGAGALAVPDQLVDRTRGRERTYYDAGPVHVSFADPYCPAGRSAAIATARGAGWQPLLETATLVVIEGPRFSTRAESRWYAAQGWELVGMTGYPEALLARELGACYIPLSLVTDVDAGVEEGAGVTQEEVFRAFAENIERLRGVVTELAAALPAVRSCPCASALDGMRLPPEIERVVSRG